MESKFRNIFVSSQHNTWLLKQFKSFDFYQATANNVSAMNPDFYFINFELQDKTFRSPLCFCSYPFFTPSAKDCSSTWFISVCPHRAMVPVPVASTHISSECSLPTVPVYVSINQIGSNVPYYSSFLIVGTPTTFIYNILILFFILILLWCQSLGVKKPNSKTVNPKENLIMWDPPPKKNILIICKAFVNVVPLD